VLAPIEQIKMALSLATMLENFSPTRHPGAMARVVNAPPICPEDILVDGNRIPEDLLALTRAIVGGDASEPAIAATSIIAKTLRDPNTLHPGFTH